MLQLPPFAGEVPRALAARAELAGAVVVTTPSLLAVADVVRGVSMLSRFGVPVLGLVENMASFQCGHCKEDHYPFGRGHLEAVRAAIGRGAAAAASTDHNDHYDDRDRAAEGGPTAAPTAVPAFQLPIVAADHADPAEPLGLELDGLAEVIERNAATGR